MALETPIVFEVLTTSPHTDGECQAALPALQAYGQEPAGAYSSGELALELVASGSVTSHVSGTAEAYLPGLASFGHDATVIATVAGYSYADLPAPLSQGWDTALPTPQSGTGTPSLPLFELQATGFLGVYGECVAYLPALAGLGLETAISGETVNGYAVGELPALQDTGYEVLPTYDNWATLVQPAGVLQAVVNTTFVKHVHEELALDENQVARAISVLVQRLNATGSPRGRLSARETIDEPVSFGDLLRVTWSMAVAEDVALSGSAAANPVRVAALIDALVAGGTASTFYEAKTALSTVIAVSTLINSGWYVSATDSVAFQAALADHLRLAGLLVENAGFDDALGGGVRLTALASDALELGDVDLAALLQHEHLAEEVLFHLSLRLGDADYAGWVLNGGAPSQYTNYPFNGFVEFDGRWYGTSDHGLYRLEGDDDAGEDIDARITTALMDFGTGKLKNVPDVYVAFIGGNRLLLKIVTTDARGRKVEQHYSTLVPQGSAMHNGRIPAGRGVESRYWQFTLQNVDGADFELDELAFRPVVLDRRL